MTGLIFATLSWLQGCESPRIEVRVDNPSAQVVRLQLVQRVAAAPAYVNASTSPAAARFAASQGGSSIGPSRAARSRSPSEPRSLESVASGTASAAP